LMTVARGRREGVGIDINPRAVRLARCGRRHSRPDVSASQVVLRARWDSRAARWVEPWQVRAQVAALGRSFERA
jgi:hypothetical protein